MKLLLKFFIAVGGIILASSLPVLIAGWLQKEWRWKIYFESIQTTLQELWPINEIAFFNYRAQRPMSLFPNVFEYITYSLQILFLALLVAVIVSLGLTIITMLLSEKARERVKMALYFLESVPDLLIIMLAQLAVVLFFKQTGILISKIAAVGDDRIYWLPVLCLAILPTIQLYRLAMLTFQEEERQMYVDLARALGFSKVYIVLVHMFRNAIISIFFQSKKTMWFMLSNLFILELMFNLPGIMLFLRDNMYPAGFLVTVFSFFLPMFFLYSFGEWYFVRRMRGKGEV
ncbi:ABC transporter permease subunit [Planomicrobium sp. MB-3u-38]|uniref:ABC transporter permease subunit n=1 Tax=Planomicrobium sp. MB-3u-38 TaxID=2058318 RepID=UPI001E551718|nr:ABC transporter permease subunit [Planomicrobium sp. MB-3u-38]